MAREATGRYVTTSVLGEEVRAFVPAPLPPRPPLRIEGPLRLGLDRALVALGRLDGMSSLLPDTHLFLYTYIRKEAVLSSQIEGTQSSLSDLLRFELDGAPGVPFDDVVEVSNYVAALQHGLDRIRGGFPLSNRLLREIHEVLLSRGRGANKSPGEFRRSQNWIGGTRPGNARFVPPPPADVEPAMGELEHFLHGRPEPTPPLLKAAFAHVQFETIHPFLDGNGRVGRLLVTLLLCAEGVLREPLLYLSLFLKHHRDEYYDRLDRVRRDGDWEAWVEFFAQGVAETAESATSTAHRLLAIAEADRQRIQQIGRRASTAMHLHHALQKSPINTGSGLISLTGLSRPSVDKGIEELTRLGLVREVTGKKRDRVYSYDRYLAVLSEGTEPL